MDNARPWSVSLATALMASVAIGYLFDAVALLVGVASVAQRFRDGAADAGVDPDVIGRAAPGTALFVVVTVVMTLIAAGALVALVILVRRGNNVGRIITWVLAGLMATCSLCGIGSAGGGVFGGFFYVTAASQENGVIHGYAARIPQLYPDLYRNLSLTVGLLSIAALITAATLLAIPRSNDYFRDRYEPPPAPLAFGVPSS